MLKLKINGNNTILLSMIVHVCPSKYGAVIHQREDEMEIISFFKEITYCEWRKMASTEHIIIMNGLNISEAGKIIL